MTKTTTNSPRPDVGDPVKGVVRDYKTIREEYRYDADIFSTEADRTARLKWIIENKLSQVDQTLILMYADCMSLRKLGKRLGISHTLLGKEIKRIRGNILAEYNKLAK